MARRSRVSLIDVAGAAGVSKSTASRALLRGGEISDATREHVRRTAERLGYIKDFHAHSLKSNSSATIAIYVRSLQLGYYGELIASTQVELERSGYRLAITTATVPAENPLERLLALRPAALVVASGRVALEPFLAHRQVPIVFAGHPTAGGDVSSVADDPSGCDVLARRVVDHGHRRVGVLTVPPERSRTLGLRVRRIDAALRALGAEVVPIATRAADDGPAAAQLDRALERVTAIMCPSDPTLIATWDLLIERGLETPADISLTGYDGAGLLASPAIGLTTWARPLPAIGRAVAQELLRRLDDPDAEPRHINLHGHLIAGRTLQPYHS